MKRFIVSILLLMASITNAQEGKGSTIEIEITNIDNEQGQLLIGLYDSEGNWLKKTYKGMFGKIKDGKSQVTFTGILKGTYAISLFHDENDDGKLNMFFGIPTEDTGSSNNAPANFGPPKWEDAKFEVNGETVRKSISL